MRKTLLGLICIFLFTDCTQQNIKSDSPTNAFQLLPSTITNITFNNKITESDTLNYFIYPYLYLGAGVATADFNNDNLTDIFFTGNMVNNQLYQNLGNPDGQGFQFKNISKTAGIESEDTWTNGVTLVDVNSDGWLDIYTCVSGRKTNKKNRLFINNQDLTFTESAEKYGLADNSPSIQATFFDYDKDGDLDCYVVNYPVAPFGSSVFFYLSKMRDLDPTESDHLYRNNGDGTFTDVSQESGIANYGLSLGISIADFNEDGWEDIYISNDFATPDRFFFNNQDGTFKELLKETTYQTALFGMGCDAADFNNDGRMDLMQVDMTPNDNRRNKENMAAMNREAFQDMIRVGFHHQYMYNAVQLNRGNINQTIPKFSNIAQLSGMAATDWSWAPLFADLDNDGWKDVLITNGIKREVNNRDFQNDLKTKINFTRDLSHINFRNIPSEPIANYAFRNTSAVDELGFENVSQSWNLNLKGFSHGSAFADFDNDGDLDVVVNNMGQTAAIYKNELPQQNYLRFQLKGDKNNLFGIGTKIQVSTKENTQTQQLSLTRGYQSAVGPILHFGLGEIDKVEEIKVTWADGKVEILKNITANQILTINYQKATLPNKKTEKSTPLFTGLPGFENIKHQENYYNDYGLEPLLPYQTSKLGGHITVGDANGDGLEDFFLGNAFDKMSVLYLQKETIQFEPITEPFELDKQHEDIGSLFFDADNDGDLDLYVVSGGNEFSRKPALLQDRLYLNQNNQGFKRSNALPTIIGSGGQVKAGDFDKDGDLDLFVGGRLDPANYPHPGISYILENKGGKNEQLKFEDVTQAIAPDLQNIGMVADAQWTDYDNDNDLDLIVVGEWMPITIFENKGGQFTHNSSLIINNSTGWWYSLAQGDFDQDGDLDYIAGNLGKNYKYHASVDAPFEVYAGDFDKNNRHDIVLGYYQNKELFPLRGRECSSEQIPAIALKFKNYQSFANANLEEIYGTRNLENALHYEATTFESVYIENRGVEEWEVKPLPALVQISNINDILVDDFDQDGYLDIVLAGNLYDAEIETPRNDAGLGLFLKGDGKGDFQVIDNTRSGLLVDGNVKDLAIIKLANGQKAILAGVNDGEIKAVQIQNQEL